MLLLALAFYAAAWTGVANAEPRLTGSTRNILRNAQNGGGLLAASASHKLNGSVGERSVGSFSGGGFRMYSGLMNFIAQPGTIISISSKTKTDGSLNLAWTAPGLDGHEATCSLCYYRIDASTDPNHAFSPTTYGIEFGTTVVPGDIQAYSFGGLLPNTTYYTRVYLSDSRKMVAEQSPQDDDSTLARIPANAAMTVFQTSVAFNWTIPNGGATQFSLDASTNAFGPGGVVVTSKTADGTNVTLSFIGLNPGTTYYFRLASFNWQSEPNYTSNFTAFTDLGGPVPIENLIATGDAFAKTVLLTWTNRPFVNPAGVLVQVSNSPISDDAVNGTGYALGDAFSDGSVVKASSANASYLESGLTLDATRYFKLYSKDVFNIYSTAVSTYVILDLPPMAPAGHRMTSAADNSSMDIQWSGVASSLDGSMFKNPTAPIDWELNRYEIYRATSAVRSGWVLIGTAAYSATTYTAEIPDPAKVYFYKIVAKDKWDDGTDVSMVIDTEHNLYAVSQDQVTRMKIPKAMTGEMMAHGNSYARHMLMRVKERPQDLGGRVVRSVDFQMMQTPLNEAAPNFRFAKPMEEVTLAYQTAGGKIIPSGIGVSAAPIFPAVSANDAEQGLGAYWYNNQDYVKLFGNVDGLAQTVNLESEMSGVYQIRSLVRNSGLNLDLSGTFNKALTPNGDGLNDTAVFILDNPKDSAINGKVYDVRGSVVSEMGSGPVANSLQWDGKVNGVAAPRGVYVYRIEGEGKTFSGTVMVIR